MRVKLELAAFVVFLLAVVAFFASTPLSANTQIADKPQAPVLATGGTLTPNADAFVNQAYPTSNYGTAQQLRIDASPVVKSYLRFSVQLSTGPITKAVLRLYADSSQSTGYTVYRVADNSWGETAITYNTAPAIGTAIGSHSAVTAGTWNSVDVTSYVTANGTYSFALATTNSTALGLASRESAYPPQLVITTGTTVLPTPTPSPTPGPSWQPTAPIHAAFFYPWFPQGWTQNGIFPYTNFHPSFGWYSSVDNTIIDKQISLATQAHLQAFISSWWGPGSLTDQNLQYIIGRSQRVGSPNPNFRWSIYYEREGYSDPTPSEIASDLQYLASREFSQPGFLRVNGKPVVFVWASSSDTCGAADRWKQAKQLVGGNVYVVLKLFTGYPNCASQPDSWHQYAPASDYSQYPPYTAEVSPGFWKAGSSAVLGRDSTRFENDVKKMVAAKTFWQLITTWSEWGEGTAIEPAQEWGNTYIDILNRNFP